MSAGGSSWRAIFVGCAALVALAAAGVSIARQLLPKAGGNVEAVRMQAQNESQERAQRLLAKVPAPIERTQGPTGRIVPAHLAWQDASGGGGLLEEIDGCLPAGPGIDVVWSRGQLFLMKKKGHLDLVWSAEDINDHIQFPEGGGTCVCFDGRYVWASVARYRKAPLLVVVDPQSGKTWTLGAEDGLPTRASQSDARLNGSWHLAVGPVEPGKACIAASAGSPDLAIVEFDPETGASVKAIRGTAPPDASAPQGQEPAPAKLLGQQRPVAVLNLAAPAAAGKKSLRRVMISHGIHGGPQAGPLLIDPDTSSIELTANNSTGIAINNSRIALHDGAIYWVMRLPIARPSKVVFVRAAPPKLEEEILFDEMPEGTPVLYNDRMALLGEKCWLWKPGEKKIESVDVQVPWSFRSKLGIESSAPARKIAGEEWEMDKIFASENYGALVKTRKKTGPNAYASIFLLFQFALADDPRAAPESPAAANKPELAIEVPAGTASSELNLFAAKADDQRPTAVLGKVVEGNVDDKFRYPILARELVRQALLMAARDQLQWSTRDATLSEDLSNDGEPAARFVLSARFPYGGAARFDLQKVDADGRATKVWQEELALNEDEESPLDYAQLAEAAERWSREAFPDLLGQDGLSGEANPASADADISAAAADWLKQMSFTAQFAVVRELHHAIRRQGESDQLLAALVRSYANLGVLTEFHWNSMHKACKARALLYAQRLVARNPKSAAALRHRAYAKGLIGLHDSAVADLDGANQLDEASGEKGEKPRWLAILDAYCRFDTPTLSAFSERGDYSQLAGLLHFFHLESLKKSAAVQSLAHQLMERNPEDFRLFDAICDSCALNTLHMATQLAPAVLRETAPARLQQLSGLPADTAELLKRRALRPVGLTELAESLLQTPAQDDAGEFTWRILGRMIQETEFIQLWRRASFMRFQWAVPAEEFVAAVTDVATGHRYRPLIDLCSTDAERWQKAAETLVGRVDLEELDYSQQSAFQMGLGGAWQTRWTEQFVAAERRPSLHLDDVHRELLQRMEREDWRAPDSLQRKLMKISSGSPDAIAADFQTRRGITPEERTALEKKYPRSPQVWKALAGFHNDVVEQRRVLQTYIKLSPDIWAYKRLAEGYRREGKMDEWQATLDECLRQPSFGLEHAQLRVQIADYYMERSEWEKAKPYAEEAAETWAEWAMLCAIRCYQGLGDDKHEGVWRTRVAERYPNAQHSLDLYVWSRRTGQGDADQLFRAIEPAIAAAARQTNAGSQFMVGLFYQLGKQPRKALDAYRKGSEGNPDTRSMCFSNLWAATLAQELSEVKVRDECLERVARLKDPGFAHFRKLAKWLQETAAAGKQQHPDLAAAREIAAAANTTDRTGVNCFVASFLDLTGRQDDAIKFYRAAIADRAAHYTATYAYVCAALRDRGLTPGTDADEPEEDDAKKPAEDPGAK